MKHIHIASFSFDYERILAPIREFQVEKFYLFQEYKEDSHSYPGYVKVKETLINILSSSHFIIVQCDSDFISIYDELRKIVQNEIKRNNKVLINLSTGSKIFTSAATLIGNEFQLELYYVVPKNYYVERNYSSGIEKIVMLPTFGSPPKTVIYDPKLCFIVMPFTDELQPVYEDIIRQTIEENGLRCIRSDDFFDNRPIMDDIWESIEQSRFVVADLTKRNPNVFYEVGIAHALGKEVILLSQSLDDVPFDLRHLRCILYSDTNRGAKKLKVDLKQTIDRVLTRTTGK